VPGPTVPPTTSAEPLGRVEGVIWIDLDRDGVRDAGEAPLPGVTVTLNPSGPSAPLSPFAGSGAAASTPPAQRVTGPDGSYAFEDVVPGGYDVTADLSVTGVIPWWDSDGAGDWRVGVSVPVGTATADLAAVGSGSLSGTVFVRETQAGVGDALVSCRWSGLDGLLDTADDATLVLHADATGHFDVDAAPYGEYRCQADDAGDGATSEVATASVAGPHTTDVGLPVDRPGPPDPAGRGGLAFTGGRLLSEAALAALLVAAGLVCVVLGRRSAARR
jgi:hypothetical protein